MITILKVSLRTVSPDVSLECSGEVYLFPLFSSKKKEALCRWAN